ncbi:MAG: helix-turn-helix transcriptional regulator [Firmicutes bacterium]|nr:helix-turn-helix transcriptional regulator [Bacillota bacterium]
MKYTLAELRHKRGITQRVVATDLQLAPSTIALYELGLRTPSLRTARRIAQYYGVLTDDIIFGPRVYESQADPLDATGTD